MKHENIDRSVKISRFSTGSNTEGFLRTHPDIFYSAEDIERMYEMFWWLNNYLQGLTPVQFINREENFRKPVSSLDANDPGLKRLKDYVRDHRENSGLDYGIKSTFDDFDRAYFYRNFFKCIVAAHHLPIAFPDLTKARTVIDIGSGVGTFSIACRLMKTFPDASYVLLDKHAHQLGVASYLKRCLDFADFSILQRDAFQEFDRKGVLIASYWLCGNRENVLSKSDHDLRTILRDGMVLIDYHSNLLKFIKRIYRLRPKLEMLNIKAQISEKMRPFVGTRDVSCHMLVVDSFGSSQSTLGL